MQSAYRLGLFLLYISRNAFVLICSGMIHVYQIFISPFLSFVSQCRYYPSCSDYALLCFNKFDLTKALWLTSKRLCRCHPLCRGGVDFPDGY